MERFVEIGPADVLTSMLKNTLARHLKSQDAARNMKRRFLSYAQNAQEIQYLLDTAPAAAAEGNKKAKESITPTVATTAQVTVKSLESTDLSEAQLKVTASAQIVNVAPIPDVPVDAKEVLVAIVASKLRKNHAELATVKTIKALANGMCSVIAQRPNCWY